MTDPEERLRHDLRVAAERAQPGLMRPLREPSVRRQRIAARWLAANLRQPRTTRRLAPLMAIVAVLAIAVAAFLVSRPGSVPPSVAATSAGMPNYHVTLSTVGSGVKILTATVRDSTTGASLDSRFIARGQEPGGDTWVTAAANDRVFAISDLVKSSSRLGFALHVWILRLTPDGHVLRLDRVPQRFEAAVSFNSEPLSPDGSELAFATMSPYRVAVLSLATGAVRIWACTDCNGPADIGNWPGNGHELVVLGGDDELRLLNVSGHGGSVLANSRLLTRVGGPPGWSVWNPMVTPDGKAVLAGHLRTDNPPARTLAGWSSSLCAPVVCSACSAQLPCTRHRPASSAARSRLARRDCTL
jgi:hypothetical protein